MDVLVRVREFVGVCVGVLDVDTEVDDVLFSGVEFRRLPHPANGTTLAPRARRRARLEFIFLRWGRILLVCSPNNGFLPLTGYRISLFEQCREPQGETL
ncbi:MAG: hypothetical protein ABEH81_00410 [Halopenitus sp.]